MPATTSPPKIHRPGRLRDRWSSLATSAVALVLSACVGVTSELGDAPPSANTMGPAATAAAMPASSTTAGNGAVAMDGSACVLTPQTDGPWYASVTTFEHFDSGRTHRFRCATFGGTMKGPNTVVALPLEGLFPTPYNLVTRSPKEIYVYGGGYGDYPGAPGSFLAKVDAVTLREQWRTQLFDAPAHPQAWNYPGVAAVHANGFVYAVYRTTLAKLDPATGKVVATANLPYPAPPAGSENDTTYNGFNGFSDGRIVAKTVNREVGCPEQGFTAFMDCPCSGCVPASLVAVVDPESMRVLSQLSAPEQIGGRLSTTHYDGRDLLYLPGTSKMFRYEWDGRTLAPDEGWGPVEYIQEGQSTAPAAAMCGDWVVMQTNAVPADTPLSVIAMRQSDAQTVTFQPFAGEGRLNAKSFLPAMISCDPENSRVYVMDGGYGLVAGFALDQATGKMTRLWQERQRTLNFSTLIGPADARVWMATDIKGNYTDLGTYTEEAVVWRNAATGEELARSDYLPKMTSGALITPGPDAVTYYLGLAGTIQVLKLAAR